MFRILDCKKILDAGVRFQSFLVLSGRGKYIGVLTQALQVLILGVLCIFQLVDFEAMTASGSEAFSKIVKDWLNLKR